MSERESAWHANPAKEIRKIVESRERETKDRTRAQQQEQPSCRLLISFLCSCFTSSPSLPSSPLLSPKLSPLIVWSVAAAAALAAGLATSWSGAAAAADDDEDGAAVSAGEREQGKGR